MPSSLTEVLPKALVFSTRPPESVCGTIYDNLHAKLFLEAWNQSVYESYDSPTHLSTFTRLPLIVQSQPTGLNHHSVSVADLSFSVPPRFNSHHRGGNINPLSINYAFRPRLRSSPNPGRTTLPQETLDLRPERFSLSYRYSCRHTHFYAVQQTSQFTFSPHRTLPYR